MDRLSEGVRFLGDLFSRAFRRFDAIEGLRLGAAFSYYATFAIFPLLLLTVTVIGFVIGDDSTTRERVLDSIGGADASVRSVIDQTLSSMQQQESARKTSAVVGIVTLLFSASGAFAELDDALNKIWGLSPRSGTGIFGKVKVFVQYRLSGFACVAGIAIGMLLSLAASATLGAVADHAHFKMTPALLQTAELTASIVLLSSGIAAAFHFVPRSRPPFRDVIGGAVLTTVLLTILKTIFALYLKKLTSYSAYGVVGGVLALGTWIYLSSQILFFGATLTRAHCELSGCPAARSSSKGCEGSEETPQRAAT